MTHFKKNQFNNYIFSGQEVSLCDQTHFEPLASLFPFYEYGGMKDGLIIALGNYLPFGRGQRRWSHNHNTKLRLYNITLKYLFPVAPSVPFAFVISSMFKRHSHIWNESRRMWNLEDVGPHFLNTQSRFLSRFQAAICN